MDINYRIITSDGKVKFAGSGENSWFNLEDAKSKVEEGDMIYEYSKNGERLWEVI